jgi:outer membrane lipopolysaccharide assembly protein LptE/RlpB
MKRPARARAFALLCAVAAALGGCGYNIGGNLPPHVKTVAVPMFRNMTQQPAVETIITAAVVNAFSTAGRLKVVPVPQADAILNGEITGYNVEPIAYNAGIDAQEFRLRVTVNIQFRDVKNNTMLWQQSGLEERADFRVQGQVSQTISTERDSAAGQAAQDIGRRIVSMALDRF